MAILAEVGFTQSGATQTDLIGGRDWTMTAGASSYLSGLGGPFNIRPGWLIQGFAANQFFPNTDEVYDFTDPIPQKSFVVWARFKNNSAGGNLWSQHGAGGLYGMYDSGNALRFTTGTHNDILLPVGYQSNVTDFRMLAVTQDRGTSETKLYADGVYLTTLPSVVPNNPQSRRFGHNRFNGQLNFDVGLLQTYDHVLTDEEVSNLYDTGLVDTTIQQPFGTVNGIVFDSDSVPISGATVAVWNHASERIESVFSTPSGGDYTAYFPTVGNYSLYTSKPGVTGGRAFPVTVTSGGITFDTS